MRPIPYQNQKYQQVGKAGFDHDLAQCSALADQAGATSGSGRAGQVAKGAGVGAVAGAAAGAVGGAIWGNPGTGAAAGAASGVVRVVALAGAERRLQAAERRARELRQPVPRRPRVPDHRLEIAHLRRRSVAGHPTSW